MNDARESPRTWRSTACVPCSRNCGLVARVELAPGLVSGLVTPPHGHGPEYPDATGGHRTVGPAGSRLTDAPRRDPLAATPYHTFVRVRRRPATALAAT